MSAATRKQLAELFERLANMELKLLADELESPELSAIRGELYRILKESA